MKAHVQGLVAGFASAALFAGSLGVMARQINGWRPTILSVPAISGRVGSNISVTVRATSVDGQPASAGRPVDFYVQLPYRSVFLGRTYTNGSGYATMRFRPASYGVDAGNFFIAAQYGGDGTYAQSLPAAPCRLVR